jgi:methionyl aminopeptidase
VRQVGNRIELDIELKTADDLAIMREAGRIVAQAHEAMKAAVRPGVSTQELNNIAETIIRDHGATPTFLDYPKRDNSGAPPFPATITASINNELVHGIPSKDRILHEGDIISLDTACSYEGFVGDAAYTWAVGEVSPAVKRLLEVTEQTLYKAIEASVAGNMISDVARATETNARRFGYSVAREYTGHGVGRNMHEDPSVPNWWPRKRDPRMQQVNPELVQGMTYAIEPMVIAGRDDLIELDDHWTVVTKDGSLCAHFDHTIAITDGEPLILTLL